MSEDICYAEPAIAVDAEHIVHLIKPNGAEDRYRVTGAIPADAWADKLRAAMPNARVTVFPLARLGGAR